jgi:hypothetical protein
MQGKKGDRIVLAAAKVGGATREGEIIQVVGNDLRISYRVQWADGHESLISPGAGAAVVVPAARSKASAAKGKTGSKKPTASKPVAKKPSAKKSSSKKR